MTDMKFNHCVFIHHVTKKKVIFVVNIDHVTQSTKTSWASFPTVLEQGSSLEILRNLDKREL